MMNQIKQNGMLLKKLRIQNIVKEYNKKLIKKKQKV